MTPSALFNSTQPTDRASGDLGQLRDAARRVTGQVFYARVLDSMQNSSLKGTYGHGGRGEEVFASQLHSILAERLGSATPQGLGELLYQRLERQQRLMTSRAAVPTPAAMASIPWKEVG